MEEFKKVDVISYLKEGLETGELTQEEAVKFTRIYARKGIEGEKVSTILDSGFQEVEENYVKKDPETGNVDWVVQNVESGERWIITDAVFNKKYEKDPENPDVYKPKGGPMLASKISENIEIIPPNWGGATQRIEAGGYLLQDPTNLSDIYGIEEEAFNNTYRFVNNNKKTL